jgi:hypothetical protein
VSTYEEWRVTGTPKLKAWESTYRREDEARRFMANATAIVPWADGPHLHKRTMTATDWTEVDA